MRPLLPVGICDFDRLNHIGADYMRRAGPVSRAGSVCRDLGTSVKHIKNQLCDYREKSQPGKLGSRHRDAGISASRVENLKCYRDCRASPARRDNTFSSLNFDSEQNGSPEDRYFSFYITHKGLSDHKAT